MVFTIIHLYTMYNIHIYTEKNYDSPMHNSYVFMFFFVKKSNDYCFSGIFASDLRSKPDRWWFCCSDPVQVVRHRGSWYFEKVSLESSCETDPRSKHVKQLHHSPRFPKSHNTLHFSHFSRWSLRKVISRGSCQMVAASNALSSFFDSLNQRT